MDSLGAGDDTGEVSPLQISSLLPPKRVGSVTCGHMASAGQLQARGPGGSSPAQAGLFRPGPLPADRLHVQGRAGALYILRGHRPWHEKGRRCPNQHLWRIPAKAEKPGLISGFPCIKSSASNSKYNPVAFKAPALGCVRRGCLDLAWFRNVQGRLCNCHPAPRLK